MGRRRRHCRNLDPRRRKIAERTANGRLGIVGGLSILGTTGVVVPYSCSAWIHSIMSGVDVARASGCAHIGAATGETSEAAIRALHGLPDHALIDMGDFVGGLLKYLRAHPVPRVTIAGGPAKMTKLAEGKLDLHSKRGAVDLAALGERVAHAGGPPSLVDAIARANSALHAFELAASAGFDLPALVADGAWRTAARILAGAPPNSRSSSSGATGGCSQAADSGEFRRSFFTRVDVLCGGMIYLTHFGELHAKGEFWREGSGKLPGVSCGHNRRCRFRAPKIRRYERRARRAAHREDFASSTLKDWTSKANGV